MPALLLLGLCGAPAGAADISNYRTDDGTQFIFIVGDIEPGDGARFERFATSKFSIVLLESDGGSLLDAIRIGQKIREKGYGTAVINGSACNSSCALIWLAGSPRALSKSGRLGFHAAYTLAAGKAQESGVANAIVGRYLTLLELPAKAVVFATLAPPSTLNWLTTSNYSSTGIDLMVISDIDLGTNSKSELSSETEVWKRIGSWYVAIDHTLNDDCYLAQQFSNRTVFRIGISSQDDRRYYLLMSNPAWRSLKEGQEHRLGMGFDSREPWDVPTTVVRVGTDLVLMATFRDDSFWAEFIAANRLAVWRNRTTVTSLSMEGTAAAFKELLHCQLASLGKRQADPFASEK